MGNFAAVSVDEDPLGQDIGLRIMLFDVETGLQEVKKERIKFINRKFADEVGLAQRRTRRLLVDNEIIAFLLEDLHHLG